MVKKGRIAMLAAGALFAAQAGAMSDLTWSDASAEQFSTPEHITVFNPDGSSYSIVPVGIELATLEPVLLMGADESMPDMVTVYEPNGQVYSYEFTPIDQVTMLEPLESIVLEDAVSVAPLAWDEPVNSGTTYVAHYVSPPTYTGLLEDLS